jgi:L-2-hydroxyglutarate oxidase LhgO
MESVDAVVVGAGVVGLAVARALALGGREVLVLEASEAFGTGTSSRNSEVIHAGIYYPSGSLKARLCVEGKRMLYAYCAARRVAHRRIGKVLVACDASEIAVLDGYARKAAANGVPLEPLSAADVARMEPAVRAVAGLWSESTGIVDSHALMLALLGDAQGAGATLVVRTPVLEARALDDGFALRTGGEAPMALRCRLLVNAAGLSAQRVARTMAIPLSRARSNAASRLRCTVPLPVPATTMARKGFGCPSECATSASTTWPPAPPWLVTISTRGHGPRATDSGQAERQCASGVGQGRTMRMRPSST